MPDPTRKHAPVKLTKGWHLRRQSPFGQSSVSRLRFLFTIPRIMSSSTARSLSPSSAACRNIIDSFSSSVDSVSSPTKLRIVTPKSSQWTSDRWSCHWDRAAKTQ